MLFNSTQFIIFFPLVAVLHFCLPHRVRWALLLGASYFFYMSWEPGYVVLLLASTAAAYVAGLMIGRPGAARGRWLAFGLAVNLGLLFFFKYYNFFAGQLRPLIGALGPVFALPSSRFLLPLGISFYTFQACSYMIDVYRGRQQPERHPGIFALYVSFFPQLVAGPIERASHLLPQFREKYRFDYDAVTNGLKLMAWGFFKKIVIADRLALIVDGVYGDVYGHAGPALAVATVAFAFQIYCDFSGYTDIAIGCAQVMGFRLMNNFRRPYHAASVGEFWRRWHISLTTWFRDYVYIPLGGNRVDAGRWRLNILAVFLLSGLWHGANWTFLVWGAVHAGYVIIGRASAPLREIAAARLRLDRTPRIRRALGIGATFGLVTFAWIFFRAQTLPDAGYVFRGLATGWGALLERGGAGNLVRALGTTPADLAVIAVLVGVLEFVQVMQARGVTLETFARRPLAVRWAAYSVLVWIIVIFGVMSHKEFIYFTF